MASMPDGAQAREPRQSARNTLTEPLSGHGNVVAMGLVAFAVATIAAFVQPPRDDVDTGPAWWEFFTHPIERSAEMRLPLIAGEVNSVAATDRALLIGSTAGTFAASVDGGRTWTADSIRLRALQPTPPAPPVRSLVQQSVRARGAAPLQGETNRDSLAELAALRAAQFDIARIRSADSVIYALAGGHLFALHDSTAAWSPLRMPSDGEFRVRTFDARGADILAVGFEQVGMRVTAAMRRSRDRGATWGQLTRIAGAFPNSAVVYSGGAVVVGDSGSVHSLRRDGLLVSLRVSRHSLNAITEADGRVWAVGDSGTVMSSTDGAEWETQNVPTGVNLTAVISRNGGVWIAGGRGVLLHRADTAAWHVDQLPGRDIITDLAFDQQGIPVASTASGALFRNVGERWVRLTRGADLDFNDVAFTGERGWAVGARGRVLYTRNGGKSWVHRPRLLEQELTAIHAEGDSALWVGASNGALFRSEDRGRSWTRRGRVAGAVNDISVRGNVVVVASEAGLFASRDRLASSQQLFSNPVYSAVIGDSGIAAIAADRYIAIPYPANPPVPDTAQLTYVLSRETAVAGDVQPNTAWALTAGGAIVGFSRAFAGYSVQQPATVELRDIAFSSPDTGWVVGDRGTVLRTTDGATFVPVRDSSLASGGLPLRAVAQANGSPVVVTAGGTILRQRPDGRWVSANPNIRYPSLWVIPLWIVIAAIMWSRLRPKEEVETGVENAIVTDAAISRFDRDRLGFGRIAVGLSRFIRNVNTEPPLTIAITGGWGTGKSSLMQLLRTDLMRAGFRPVWFNAWHHQTEENLLAALLENIRAQAVPPLFSFYGPLFRMRLLIVRLRRYWPIAFVMTLVGLATLGFVVRDPTARLIEPVSTLLTQLLKFNLSGATKELLVLPGILAPVFSLWRGARAFGVNPGALMMSASRTVSVTSLRDQAGFRHRWAREFQEVTEALHPRDLVILIDDLDRLRPQQVVVALEAVNFLVSSGDCFVILGMDRDRVERAVGIGFREVADDFFDTGARPAAQAPRAHGNGAKQTDENVARARRQQYARDYLEKLVNIEVPVPRATNAQLGEVLRGDEPVPIPLRQRALTWALRAGVGTLMAAAMIAGLIFGAPDVGPPATALALTAQSVASPGFVVQPQGRTQTAPQGAPGDLGRSTPPRAPGAVHGGERQMAGIWIVVLGSALLIGLVALRFATFVSPVVRDSKTFTTTLAIWQDLLLAQPRTPRATKRFLNRVRYYAMRQVHHVPEPTRWKTFRRRVSQLLESGPGPRPPAAALAEGTPPHPGRARPIPEDALVILSVIESTHPDWLAEETFAQKPLDFLSINLGGDVGEKLVADLEERIGTAESEGGHFRAHIDPFRQLSLEIRTNS
jgi:photosystem II stability/assembly factor-like uncharacterized protein